jgi:hypothetical protein
MVVILLVGRVDSPQLPRLDFVFMMLAFLFFVFLLFGDSHGVACYPRTGFSRLM